MEIDTGEEGMADWRKVNMLRERAEGWIGQYRRVGVRQTFPYGSRQSSPERRCIPYEKMTGMYCITTLTPPWLTNMCDEDTSKH
jgi:hypothetical protein